jgi:hypothetical protein
MTTQKKILRGRRKGGMQFPHTSLKRAVQYARKLVSKTHTETQPASIILKGVFDNAGSAGKVRASALKQYDLLTGPASAYNATALAKQINSAPPEELAPLLQQACLHPRLFKSLYDTFQNDTVSHAKIKQQALSLGVHPDSGDEAVRMFVESAVFSGLAREKGGDVEITAPSALVPPEVEIDRDEQNSADQTETDGEADGGTETDEGKAGGVERPPGSNPPVTRRLTTRSAQMQVNLSLDSTMDPEKLEKSLNLLKKFGVI